MTEKIWITSPTGRFVQGDVFEGSDKDMQGRPRLTQQGQPKTQWFIGVAFPKGPEWDAMWAQIAGVGQRDFPGGEFNQPGFAWKVVDGDDPAHAGKAGFPGHFILRMSTGFVPTAYNEANQQITAEHRALKRGDYVLVYFSVGGNGEPATGKPGLYLNHSMVGLVRPGEAIQSGPSAEQAFGGARQVVAPPTPVGGMPAPMTAPAPVYAPPAAPALAAPITPAPAVAPAPAPLAPAPMQPPVAPGAIPATGAPGTPAPSATAYPSNTPPPGVPVGTQPAPGFAAPPAAAAANPGQPGQPGYPQQ